MIKTYLQLSFIIAVISLIAFSCSNNKKSSLLDQRPNDPWVFRSVLDSIPRVVTFALHEDMWVAYGTEDASLYKAWKGRVNFDGPVYTTHHGPQPTSVGDAWISNNHQKPWRILQNGQEIEPKDVQYKGHRFEGEHAHLMFELTLADGKNVKIIEQPEYVETENGIGLERLFTTSDVPDGIEIGLKMNISSVAYEERIKIEGGVFKPSKSKERANKGLHAVDVDGFLTLKSNGTTKMTTFFVKRPMIDHPKKQDLIKEESEKLDPGYVLIAKNDCKTCHNTYRQTVGPAYLEVARRYENNTENLKKLVKKVKVGGAGNWGTAAMNAHPNLVDGDIQTMVQYILNLDAEEEAEKEDIEEKGISIEPLADTKDEDYTNGILVKFFQNNSLPYKLADFKFSDYNGLR